jgi:hypothetical protein
LVGALLGHAEEFGDLSQADQPSEGQGFEPTFPLSEQALAPRATKGVNAVTESQGLQVRIAGL